MADNTAQNGTETIRTDDKVGGSVKTQIVMLDVAAEGVTERTGLPPTSVITVAASGLTTATTAYVTGDVLGGELTFANAARATGLGTQIVSAVLMDKAKVTGAVDLFLFDRASTPAADNAANSWADADMANCVGVINFPTPITSALNSVAVAVGGLPLLAIPNATSLFGVLVTRSGHTFFGAATDLQVKLGVIPD